MINNVVHILKYYSLVSDDAARDRLGPYIKNYPIKYYETHETMVLY